MPARSSAGGRRVRLKPQNPFDLIKLLARSQSDPRKAVAELVQNSLDAGARRIEITWFNDQGQRALRIWDDGRGVFPEMAREDALRRIAQTIGHSYKLDLTPSERRDQMVLGKYGIGLIGFWSVGAVMEIKSRVGTEPAFVLRLREDVNEGEVYPARRRIADPESTFTEITIRGVHDGAVSKIRPPRLQAYLANELRGQLLERDAKVDIRDRVARGRARKHFTVQPRPFLGRPVEDLRELEVPGFESARLELYLVDPGEDRRGAVALACGGTVVLDDVAEIEGAGQQRAPWASGRLEGVIDFPELHVAPSTRRGFAHDEPVEAFLAALGPLERELAARLEAELRREVEQRQESLARDIRRAFRAVARRLPEYDLFAVKGRGPGTGDAPAGAGTGSAAGTPRGPAEDEGAALGDGAPSQEGPAEPGLELAPSDEMATAAAEPAPEPEPPERDGLLFPPGPLAAVHVTPARLRLAPLASRTVTARAVDADGRAAKGAVAFAWFLTGPGSIETDGARVTYTAPDLDPGATPPIRLRVVASDGEREASAEVPVQLAESSGAAGRVGGIPEPVPVVASGESWRSRFLEGRWEYNSAHRDYLEACESDARRLRYLIHLFAKEVVLRNFGGPGDAEVLERMVEVLTHLDGRGRG